MRLLRIFAALVAAGCAVVTASPQTTIAPEVARASRGLAHISVLFETETGSTVRVERASSGFVIDPRGIVLTNDHLVAEIPTGGGAIGAEYWLLVSIGGGRECEAKVLARNPRLDLALLELRLESLELIPALELAPGGGIASGADAFALSRPRGSQLFSLAGVVSMASGPVTLREGILEASEVLLTDAAVLEEMDGGPFVDRRGFVLGILNTVQRVPFDPRQKEEDATPPNQVDYALAVTAAAIRRAFPEQLAAPDETGGVSGAKDSTAAMVRAAADSVVSVWRGDEAARPQRSEANDPYARKLPKELSSGVIVDPAGLVLTSSAVVGAAEEVSVRLLDGRVLRAKVLRTMPDKRAALLSIALPEGERLPALEMGSSDAALGGEVIAVIGNPYGHTATVSAGVLSALETEGRVRIGAWVHDGHRGGALIDATGRLIGLPAADIFEGEERKRGESYLGVALPIDRAREWFAEEFEKHATAPGVRSAVAATEEQLARRSDKVTSIVTAMRNSLLNVEVKARSAGAAAFDPFASEGELNLLGQGSGVVIDASGLAITNWHVVQPTLAEDGTQRSDHAVEVTLPSGKRHSARVLAASRDDDLALIQLELSEGEVVQPVTLGTSKPLRRGDVVVAIGNPYGKANTVTVGIVAAKDQDALISGRLHVYPDMLQTDAAINPGNSGGALLDVEGHLVGINSAGRSGAGLAIPVERVREVFGQKLLATMGPFVGVSVEDAPGGGIRVGKVDEHSPAEKAGVKAGDLLRSIDGRALSTTTDYGNLLLAHRGVAVMRADLERGGKTATAEISPVSQVVWRIFRQTGIEVAEVEYASEAARVREASIALHRSYTGLSDGEPSRLMSGALRVVQVQVRGTRTIDVQAGDLLLGASAMVRTVDTEHASLARFERLNELRDFLEPLASKEGGTAECWLMRGEAVLTSRVIVVKVR